ncbi:MAG TPA: tyrosine-protein phosphatase, partial [Anaerolineales bacterium]|nr:tyrosine-protein phosphatase [Anaerolineales bacterium]
SPHLLCGPHPLRPGRETLDALLTSGVTSFIDLTEPGELPEYDSRLQQVSVPSLAIDYSQFTIKYSRFPIRDYSTPTLSHMTAILKALDAALAAGHTVYLHCHGGRGRTGTVVGCWLVRQGMTGPQALARIAELRGDHESPETDEQRAFVLNWEENSQKEMQ